MRRAALALALLAPLAGCAALPEGAPTLGDAVVTWVAQMCAESPAERADILEEFASVTSPNAVRVECVAR